MVMDLFCMRFATPSLSELQACPVLRDEARFHASA